MVAFRAASRCIWVRQLIVQWWWVIGELVDQVASVTLQWLDYEEAGLTGAWHFGNGLRCRGGDSMVMAGEVSLGCCGVSRMDDDGSVGGFC